MSRAQLARLSGLALFSVAFSSLAQAPGASPAPSTRAPAGLPPAPAPDDTAAPAAETPAPAAAPPADDSWSKLMRQGHQQERANETDEDRQRREEREAREHEPRLAADALRWRNRLRFFPWVGLGVQYSPDLQDNYYGYPGSGTVTQTTVSNPSFEEGIGWDIDLGVGVRGGVAQHFDLQARLALTIEGASVEASGEVQEPGESYASSGYGDGSVGIVGARLDATVRWLPGLLAPRFFVGLGPSVEASSASGSGTLYGSGSRRVERDQTILSVMALLELGVIFGGSEEWEAALRMAAGPTNEGELRGFALATVARSF